MDSLFAPLGPLSPHLEPYRFWIWLQMVAWRLYVRAVKGRGIPFMTVIDRQGTVYLKWIGHPPHEFPQAPDDPLAFTPSKAFRIALGDLPSAHPGERGRLSSTTTRTPTCAPVNSPVSAHAAAVPAPDT
ncbi:MAG TPA: hypothetical protein DEB52_16405 [Hyphomonas sp.]|nr:hypothetical protein [Hyphomonas sp.]